MRVQHGLLRFVREAAMIGEPLPGELELTARLECTRQQLRNAMAALEAQGIVRRRQGTVTTVDPIALRLSVRLEEQFEHSDLLNRLGFEAEIELLSHRERALGAALAALMELPEATPSIEVRKRWRADGAVAMVADDVIALAGRAHPGDAVDFSRSIFGQSAALWGEAVIWEVSSPSVALLDDELAECFDRPVGTPVMTLETVGIGASGRRLFYSLEYHDPSLVSYSLVRQVRPPWGV